MKILDWSLRAGSGFVLGFGAGLVAVTLWLIWTARRQVD